MSYPCRPPLGTPIDWGHPLAQGLVAWIDADGDRVSGAPLSLMGAAVRNADGTVSSPGGSGDGAYLPFLPGLSDIGTEYTLLIFARLTALAQWGALLGIPYTSVWSLPYDSLSLQRYSSTGQLASNIGYSSSARTMVAGPEGFLSLSSAVSCLGIAKTASGVRFYRDGVSSTAFTYAEGSVLDVAPDFTNRQPLVIGNRSATSPGEALGGVFLPGLVYSRALDEGGMAFLNANPWAMFSRRRLFFLSAPGVAASPARFAVAWRAPAVPVATRGVRRAVAGRCATLAGRLVAGRCARPVERAVAGRCSAPGWLSRAVAGGCAVLRAVSRAVPGYCATLDHTPLFRAVAGRAPVLPADAVLRPADWAATFDDDGAPLDLLGAELSGDLESFAWSANLTLADADAYAACEPGRALALRLAGVDFKLVVESRDRDLASGTAGYTATARTLSCLLDAPYAAALTQSWPALAASDAAVGLAALAGLACSWEVCDWQLPAGRLTAENETPAAVLARLAASCGAALQPAPGGGVRVVYRYTVGVTELPTAAASGVLSGDDSVLTLSETWVAGLGYDSVTVVDNRAATDAYLAWELDADRNAGRTTFPVGEPAYFRVWHGVPYSVRTTSGTLEQVATDEEETLTEVLSFDDTDAADTAKLVAHVTSVTWWGADLGTPEPSGAAGVVLPHGAGFSVAELVYVTKYDVWRLVPANLADTYQVLLELSEADT